jgi:hypothetical protein
MSVMSDVRTYADTALDQGKSYASAAGSDARQLAFAVVGVGEIALSAVNKRVERIPAQAQKAVAEARGLTPTSARSAVDAYVTQARNVIGSLAEHGEKVVQQLRTDPRVESAKAKADLAGADVAELARKEPARRTERKATGRRTAAKKTTSPKRARTTSAK